MLHEKYLPQYHFSEKHQIVIRASPEKIFPFVENLDISGSWIIRSLFLLRGMPARMMQMRELNRSRFIQLDHQENKEIVIGLIGQFWKLNGNLQEFEAHQFIAFNDTRFAKAVWNFELKLYSSIETVLATETRIYCPDETAKKRFTRYWFAIRPFSSLIRKEILKSIKAKAEGASGVS